MIVGRYKKPGDAKVIITGKVGDKEQKFDFPAKLVEKSSDESYAFVEKLWAMRRIGEIIDEIDLKGKNDELSRSWSRSRPSTASSRPTRRSWPTRMSPPISPSTLWRLAGVWSRLAK